MEKTAFGLKFDGRSTSSIAEAVTKQNSFSGVRLVCTANVDHIVNIHRVPALRIAYSNAYLVTADGTPIYLYAKAKGSKISERVTGSDLFPAIMERLRPGSHRAVFVASSDNVARQLTKRMIANGFARDSFLVSVPPFGFESDAEVSSNLASQIKSANATHLFFGLGSPKSEVWIDANRSQLGDLYAFGFGTALDYYAGTAKRAPIFLQRTGLEWLWRLLSEPKRLARRYLLNSWGFIGAVIRDLRAQQ